MQSLELQRKVSPIRESLRRVEQKVMEARMLVQQGAWIPALDLISDARTALSIQENTLNDYAAEEVQKAPEVSGLPEANG